jgi:short-subunit dehydrogenase
MHVEGKIVLITGASEGIGAACAAAFRQRGARVVLVARSADKLAAVARQEDLVLTADLTDESSREQIISRTRAHFGRIDVLVNNAGAGLYVPAHEACPADAHRLFELNFFAPLHLVQLVAPDMKRLGSGAIVNISSVAGKVTLPWFTLYSASKQAIASLGDGLRLELRRYGIHCMNVFPGYFRTNFQNNVLKGRVPPALGGLKRRWSISPEQCAGAIVRGLERNARSVVAPWSGSFLVAAYALAPVLVDRFFERIYLSESART